MQAMLLAQQPAIDDVPFVAASGLEVQKPGLVVLQLEIEFERVAAAGMIGIEGLGPQPAVPFLDDECSCFLLLHQARPVFEPFRALVIALVFT